MKKIIIALMILLININLFSQEIPNGDFEMGKDTLSLQDWHTINELTGIFFPFNRTKDAYSGNYAVKLKTLSVFNTLVPGLATLGNISIGAVSGSIYFPHKPDKLIGYYKHPTPKDNALIRVYFLKNKDNSTDTIGLGMFFPEGDINQYTPFEIKINYKSDEIPDSMNILLISDIEKVNSTFYIDKLEFVYNTTSVGNNEKSIIKLFPNPTQSYLNITTNDIINIKYYLIDIFGRIIKSGVLTNNNIIDLTSQPSGIYYLKMGNQYFKIVKF